MILLPIGHEHTTVRRLPWVTLGIVALCLVAFLISGRARPTPREDDRIEDDVLEAIEWYSERPYLRIDEDFRQTFLRDAGQTRLDEMLGYLAEVRPTRPPLDELLAEQEHLDAIMSRAVDRYYNHTLRKWGLVPAHVSARGWITHMFLHVGWLHLIGNMLILFLAGPFIEDVWGRPLYAALYGVSGLVAAGFHILSRPDSTIPMIGASGAIAGVMGAFLIRYHTTRIKFFYLWMTRGGTFSAPAWVMIPLWFVSQVWMGLLTGGLDLQAGVAYWAHVGGFVAGVATAWIVKSKAVEERYVHPRIESKITLEVDENRAVVEALDARATDPELAFRMLSIAVMDRPRNHDAAAALWELGKELGHVERAAPLMLRSIGHQLRSGDVELALTQWLDVRQAVPDLRGDPRQLVRLAQALIDRHHHEDALETLRLALQSGGSGLDPTLALTIARIARDFAPATARAAAEIVTTHPDADPEAKARARELLDGAPSDGTRAIPLAT